MTAARWGVGVGLGLLVTQAAVRLGVTPRADAWALVSADADGALFWSELSISNTGLLADQLTTRVLLLPAGPGSIEHRAQWGTGVVGEHGVEGGADALVRSPGGWELRVGGDGLGARAHAAGADAGCPPLVGEVAGMVEDRVDGRLLSGPGVVVRTRAEGHPVGTALYVLGQGVAASIDALADCPAWIRVGDEVWTGQASVFTAARTTALTLGSWTLTFRSIGDPIVHDAWAHALPAERAIASAFGFRAPVHEARRAMVRVEGPGIDRPAPALVLRRL
jgi:hypothetical protein